MGPLEGEEWSIIVLYNPFIFGNIARRPGNEARRHGIEAEWPGNEVKRDGMEANW